jgi:hypothetical protein
MKVIILLCLLIFCFMSDIKNYENYRYIKIVVNKQLINEFKNSVILSGDGSLKENEQSEILLSPQQYQRILNNTHEVVIENFQKFLNEEMEDIHRSNIILENKLKLAKNDKEKEDLKYEPNIWFANYHKCTKKKLINS